MHPRAQKIPGLENKTSNPRKRSASPIRAIGTLKNEYSPANPQVDKVSVLAVIPDLSSEQLVFGNRKVNRGQILDGVAHSLDGAGANVFRSQTNAEILEAIVPASRNELVVLVGHSVKDDDGRQYFVFPDGKRKDFKSLHAYAREKDFHLLILSCNSPDFRLDRAVSFQTAAEAVSDFLKSPQTRLSKRLRSSTASARTWNGVKDRSIFVLSSPLVAGRGSSCNLPRVRMMTKKRRRKRALGIRLRYAEAEQRVLSDHGELEFSVACTGLPDGINRLRSSSQAPQGFDGRGIGARNYAG